MYGLKKTRIVDKVEEKSSTIILIKNQKRKESNSETLI